MTASRTRTTALVALTALLLCGGCRSAEVNDGDNDAVGPSTGSVAEGSESGGAEAAADVPGESGAAAGAADAAPEPHIAPTMAELVAAMQRHGFARGEELEAESFAPVPPSASWTALSFQAGAETVDVAVFSYESRGFAVPHSEDVHRRAQSGSIGEAARVHANALIHARAATNERAEEVVAQLAEAFGWPAAPAVVSDGVRAEEPAAAE